LTIDTVIAYELVRPDGNVVNVTRASDPELFFGLKVRLPIAVLVLSLLVFNATLSTGRGK